MIIRQPGNLGNLSAPRAPAYDDSTTERHGIVGRKPGTGRENTEVPGLPDDLESGGRR